MTWRRRRCAHRVRCQQAGIAIFESLGDQGSTAGEPLRPVTDSSQSVHHKLILDGDYVTAVCALKVTFAGESQIASAALHRTAAPCLPTVRGMGEPKVCIDQNCRLFKPNTNGKAQRQIRAQSFHQG